MTLHWRHHLHLQVSALVGLSCMRLKPKSLCSSWICWTSPLSALAIDELPTTFKNSTMTLHTCLICIDLCNTTTLLTSLKVPLEHPETSIRESWMLWCCHECLKQSLPQRWAASRKDPDNSGSSPRIQWDSKEAASPKHQIMWSCESCGTRKQLAGKRTAAVFRSRKLPNASG